MTESRRQRRRPLHRSLPLRPLGYRRRDVEQLIAASLAEEDGRVQAWRATMESEQARLSDTRAKLHVAQDSLGAAAAETARLEAAVRRARVDARWRQAEAEREIARLREAHQARLEVLRQEERSLQRQIGESERELQNTMRSVQTSLQASAPNASRTVRTSAPEGPGTDRLLSTWLEGGAARVWGPFLDLRVQSRAGLTLGRVTAALVMGDPPRVAGYECTQDDQALGVIPEQDVLAVTSEVLLVRAGCRFLPVEDLPPPGGRVLQVVRRPGPETRGLREDRVVDLASATMAGPGRGLDPPPPGEDVPQVPDPEAASPEARGRAELESARSEAGRGHAGRVPAEREDTAVGGPEAVASAVPMGAREGQDPGADVSACASPAPGMRFEAESARSEVGRESGGAAPRETGVTTLAGPAPAEPAALVAGPDPEGHGREAAATLDVAPLGRAAEVEPQGTTEARPKPEMAEVPAEAPLPAAGSTSAEQTAGKDAPTRPEILPALPLSLIEEDDVHPDLGPQAVEPPPLDALLADLEPPEPGGAVGPRGTGEDSPSDPSPEVPLPAASGAGEMPSLTDASEDGDVLPAPAWAAGTSWEPEVAADRDAETASPAAAQEAPRRQPGVSDTVRAARRAGGVGADVMAFLVGKRVGQDIYDAQGQILARLGSPIDQAVVESAEAAGRLPELIVHMTLAEDDV